MNGAREKNIFSSRQPSEPSPNNLEQRSMVDGRWSMVDGRWSMVDGRWLKLAECWN
ncbi:MAG: hypothetical protein P8Q84_03420 [Luminiphilus sp.]|nr:hypothetical protein [Luminiphilus sp.]